MLTQNGKGGFPKVLGEMKGCLVEEYQEHNDDERRQFNRIRRAQPVQFQLKDPSQYGGCLSCDLSQGGIRVQLNDFIPLNTEMTLQIRLSDESVVDCPCRVAWVEKSRFSDRYQAGLEFEGESTLDSQRKIHRFLSSQ
jgi:Tfp pilus assembly protein PilZ